MTEKREAMDRKANAFITTRKGFRYLTAKLYGRHHHMMRVRAYKIEPQGKRDMRRLYPEVVFDWKKIMEQLAAKREDCRRYRTRGRRTVCRDAWEDEPQFAIYEPGTRTIYSSGAPCTFAAAGRLLDAVVQTDRELAGPELRVIQGGEPPKPR